MTNMILPNASSEATFLALVTLPLELKVPLILHGLNGVEISEVATFLNLEEEAVIARISEGMEHLNDSVPIIEEINYNAKLAA